jgi:tRNA dimethylallyltransferase
VGKTEIALTLAERWNGEIVSADSRLLYRGMDIGTAKPSAEQRSAVVHHLIDVANPDETWSLALFQQEAARAIESIQGRGKLPILVGGTGQYMNAILKGWQPPAVAPQAGLRAALAAWEGEIGKQALHDRLAVIDPEAAAAIDARNARRTLRALEVTLASGRKFSAQRGRGEPPYRVLLLGLRRPQAELYARIDARIDAMLAAGWLDEVRGLLARGYTPDLPSFSAIGYPELAEHLQGRLSLEDAVSAIRSGTRAFVRRQATWFKPGDASIRWVDLGQQDAEAKIDASVAEFLGGGQQSL